MGREISGDPTFKVVIIGGSIAGLTLAHCLHRAGIDYVVLEKRSEVAPQEGASIGIMPNGARILEQLDLYAALEETIHPLETAHVTYPDGFCYTSQYPTQLTERFGFPLAFLDRQKVLQHLADSLPDTGRVSTRQSVVKIQQYKNSTRVYTQDGSCFQGDLIVGADGVHSLVREEMWRLAAEAGSEIFRSPVKEKEAMSVEYGCVFGISSAHPSLPAGRQITCYNDNWSILSVIGKDGRIFWFLFFKLDRKFTYSSAPRFSVAEATERCAGLAGETFWQETTFGDIWKRREVFNMTTLEEYVMPRWYWSNIVCIGDSMHKIAPHTGQGANCAMEDAAALCNALQRLLNSEPGKGKRTPTQIDNTLNAFCASRCSRMEIVSKSAKLAMRLHARDGLFYRLLGRYYFPYAGDMPADKASQGIANADMLESMPIPERSGPGWESFRVVGKEDLPVLKIIVALVVAGFVWYCWISVSR
ncbi:hypothetical protein BJX99DRAFT_237342 [Aspergillus californicus]